MSNLKTHIYELINEIASAEKITKVKLGIISRDLLMYVPDSADIEAVNRLLSILTPMNKRTAILFFSHFLPWDAERNNDGVFQRFGKKTKGEKKLTRCANDIKEFLSDESNNIWTWADANVEIESKRKDFAGLITRTIEKALEGDERSNTPALEREKILEAVFAGGVSIEDMMEAIDVMEAKRQAELEAAEAIMNTPKQEAA